MRRLALLAVRRFRWVALGALLRALSRRVGQTSVDSATGELAAKLPDPVVKSIDAAPGDLMRVGGRALAASRAARRVGQTSRRMGGVGRHWRDRSVSTVALAQSLRRDWRSESEQARREFWADYHRAQGDHQSADEALLDRRAPRNERPLPEIPDPVPPGRRRLRTAPRPVVNRVQRSYRRMARPWDR
jgi:hypothetical protein